MHWTLHRIPDEPPIYAPFMLCSLIDVMGRDVPVCYFGGLDPIVGFFFNLLRLNYMFYYHSSFFLLFRDDVLLSFGLLFKCQIPELKGHRPSSFLTINIGTLYRTVYLVVP